MGTASGERQAGGQGLSAGVAARLQRALDHAGNTHTIDDVLAAIERRDAQVWTAPNSLIVTELVSYPRLTSLRYWLGAGDLHEVLSLHPEIETWARRNGCTRAEGLGRRGWERVMGNRGWRHAGAWMVKDLTT